MPSDPNTRLEALFDRYVLLDPRSHSGTLDSDIDVDLWAEDSYLAGLVISYLKKDRLSIDEIVLDDSIDRRLVELVTTTPEPKRGELERFVRYRAKMRELAEALSAATGIPLGNGIRPA